MAKPGLENVPTPYQRYVNLVSEQELIASLEDSRKETRDLILSIPESKGLFSYLPGKWTIKESLCHMIDVERIFAYRALRFARNDKTGLAGFEENDYAPESNAHSRSVAEIAEEMNRLRLTTIDLFKSFTPEMLLRGGKANQMDLTVLALGYAISGHETHHRNIFLERYLVK